MQKLDTDTKRTLDSEFTGQILRIPAIRGVLERLCNAFLQLFAQDTYPVFPNLTLPQLCDVSVKGGLGMENLRAQAQHPPPETLVWGSYTGDCDLNLLIKKSSYPAGAMSGEVMARVAKRTKILMVQAIEQIFFNTAADEIQRADMYRYPTGEMRDEEMPRPGKRPRIEAQHSFHYEHAGLQNPLCYCTQVEALTQVVSFAYRALPLGNAVHINPADLSTILNMIKSILPRLADIFGPDFDAVCKTITGSRSNQWIVYDNPEKDLLFVSDLERLESTWTDVDYSFFPYAPGRVDSQGYEISELAMRQALARQHGVQLNPYDIFKIATSTFAYTDEESMDPPPDERDNRLHKANPKQNLSMYANNLIDDFALLRSALRFHGHALKCREGNDYTVNVFSGTAKCEFLDVAIPRIGSPEWFYCQNRTYYGEVPSDPGPRSQMQFKICNWEYQVEENLNLLIELGMGLSHSTQKAGKRITRFCESWQECTMADVFPRQADGPLPPKVPVPFQAPAVLVANWVSDYTHLYSIGNLPDWLYNEIFAALFVLHRTVATFQEHEQNQVGQTQLDQDESDVKNSAETFGEIGLVGDFIPMANPTEADAVSALRTLVKDGHIEVNWVTATYLLLKASRLADIIRFPCFGILHVKNDPTITINPPNVQFNNDDYVMVTWKNGPMGPPLSYFTLPATDAQDPTSQIPNRLYSGNLEDARRAIYRDIRQRLMRANNQALRVTYGRILNALYRTASDAFLSDVLG